MHLLNRDHPGLNAITTETSTMIITVAFCIRPNVAVFGRRLSARIFLSPPKFSHSTLPDTVPPAKDGRRSCPSSLCTPRMDQLRAEGRTVRVKTDPRRSERRAKLRSERRRDNRDKGSGKAKDNHVKKQAPRAANNMIAVAGLALAAS